MSLFKTDPLLAFCKLTAWLIFIGIAFGGVACIVFIGAALFGGEAFAGALRQSYPQMQAGAQGAFAVAMAFILVALGLVGRFMLHLLAIIRSIQAGEAFKMANAMRIRGMAWISLAGIPAGIAIAGALSATTIRLGEAVPDAGIHIRTMDGLSPGFGQVLMTLLLFVLARLFAQAAAMRDEIEGTV